MSLAILMRSALVTLSSWRSMFEVLEEKATDHLGAIQVLIQKQFRPNHGDCCSIAELLHDAALGFPSSKRLQVAGSAALAAFRHEKKHSKRFPKGVQEAMYQAILPAMYVDSIPSLLCKRMRVLDPLSPRPANLDFSILKVAISSYSEYIVFTIVRAWANAWTTSHWMHEPLLRSCILGCDDEKDDLHHFLRCDRF